jgi:hypothetical protein
MSSRSPPANCLLYISICFSVRSAFNFAVGSEALISFSISPLRTAASICFLRAADLSNCPDIACIILFCKVPDLIDPFKSAPSS